MEKIPQGMFSGIDAAFAHALKLSEANACQALITRDGEGLNWAIDRADYTEDHGELLALVVHPSQV